MSLALPATQESQESSWPPETHYPSYRSMKVTDNTGANELVTDEQGHLSNNLSEQTLKPCISAKKPNRTEVGAPDCGARASSTRSLGLRYFRLHLEIARPPGGQLGNGRTGLCIACQAEVRAHITLSEFGLYIAMQNLFCDRIMASFSEKSTLCGAGNLRG
jgi:hypothetical protein